tara:strand:+ start:29 stop:487 length:459 start_codon:yes stop_codon:yes gene_type:complete
MTTPRRLGPSVDIDALKHIYDVQEQIREARRKAVRKDHQWDYRHSEKGIANRKNYRKNTVTGLQHRINTLVNRQNKLKAAKMVANQRYDTSDMFWNIKEEFPEMSIEDIVEVMTMRPSKTRGQESVLEFLDSLGEVIGPGSEFYNYPGGSDI